MSIIVKKDVILNASLSYTVPFYSAKLSSVMWLLLLKVHLEGGWIGVNANLRLNEKLNALNAEANANVTQTNTIQQV